MDFFTTANQIFILFAIVLVGAWAGRSGIVSSHFRKDLNNFIYYISIPCNIVNAMIFPFDKSILADVLALVGISVVVIVATILIAKVVVPMLSQDIKQKCVYEFGFTFNNFGFMGLPVCQTLLGAEGLLYASVYTIPLNVIYFAYGAVIFAKAKGENVRMTLKGMITPPTVATLIGLIIFAFSIPIPTQVGGVVEILASTTTPLAMTVSGIVLASSSFKTLFTNPMTFVYSAIRLLFLPFIVLIVLTSLGFSGLMVAVPVILAAMPSAANATILSDQYGADSYLAAQCIFISTLFSVVTIPVLSIFLK